VKHDDQTPPPASYSKVREGYFNRLIGINDTFNCFSLTPKIGGAAVRLTVLKISVRAILDVKSRIVCAENRTDIVG
jgi:hypothetical protein